MPSTSASSIPASSIALPQACSARSSTEVPESRLNGEYPTPTIAALSQTCLRIGMVFTLSDLLTRKQAILKRGRAMPEQQPSEERVVVEKIEPGGVPIAR